MTPIQGRAGEIQESAAVRRFAGILYPNCLAPVEFTEYEQVDTAARAELTSHGAKHADVL